MIEYVIVAFICGFGCGLVLLAKNMKDNKKEVERIIKTMEVDRYISVNELKRQLHAWNMGLELPR